MQSSPQLSDFLVIASVFGICQGEAQWGFWLNNELSPWLLPAVGTRAALQTSVLSCPEEPPVSQLLSAGLLCTPKSSATPRPGSSAGERPGGLPGHLPCAVVRVVSQARSPHQSFVCSFLPVKICGKISWHLAGNESQVPSQPGGGSSSA